MKLVFDLFKIYVTINSKVGEIMLEIGETTIISNQMNGLFRGKIVKEIIVGETPHKFAWFYEPVTHYIDYLIGNQFIEASSIGSMIEITFGQDVIMILGEGEDIIYVSSQDEIPLKHQLLVLFDDNTGFHVKIKLYGWLLVGKRQDLHRDILYYRLAKERQNVLSKGFTLEYFMNNIIKPNVGQSLKAALATKQNIPGLGNGTLQDILWNAYLHPKTKVSTLSENEKVNLYHSIINTVNDIIVNGGRSTETSLFGQPGGYQVLISNKSKHCVRCASDSITESYLGGKIYFCKNCQPYQK